MVHEQLRDQSERFAGEPSDRHQQVGPGLKETAGRRLEDCSRHLELRLTSDFCHRIVALNGCVA